MNKITKYFYMMLISLILTFYPEFIRLGGGLVSFINLFPMLSTKLDRILYIIINLIGLFSNIIFFYSLIMFGKECVKQKNI